MIFLGVVDVSSYHMCMIDMSCFVKYSGRIRSVFFFTREVDSVFLKFKGCR